MNADMFALDPSVEEVLNLSTFEVCVCRNALEYIV